MEFARDIVQNSFFTVLILAVYLLIGLFIAFYNWLIHSKTVHANSFIGIHAPKYIGRVIKWNIYFAFFTAALLIVFLIIMVI